MGSRKVDGKLTPKEQAFVREYMVDFNATQAAMRAGYTAVGPAQTARAQGSALLDRPIVAEALRVAMAEAASRNSITVDRVLAEYERIAFGSITNLFEIGGGKVKMHDHIEESAARTIQSIEQTSDVVRAKDGSEDEFVTQVKLKVRLHDKLGALNALAKYLGIDKPDAQRIIQEFLESVRTRMSAEAYAELFQAVESEMGATVMAPQAAGSGDGSSGDGLH